MRIATWNVNNVASRLPLLLAWLDATKPDVVTLQELKVVEGAFPRAELAAAGYQSLVVGEKSWNGVAILARGNAPVEIRRRLPGDAKDSQARYIEAAVNGVIFAGLYAPNGNPFPGPKFDYKMAWMGRLIEHAASLWKSSHSVVLAGDFNVIPTDFDIYANKSYADNALLQPAARTAYSRLLKQGWTDSLRKVHPKEPMYTFWDYRRNRWQRDAGLRIDHILLSKSLKPRLAGAGVDRAVRGMENSSDHAPAWSSCPTRRHGVCPISTLRSMTMSEILARALVREFPGEDLNRLLVDNPLARVATVKSAKYVVIPKKEGDAAYYAYRQGSLHRLISKPSALRNRANRPTPSAKARMKADNE